MSIEPPVNEEPDLPSISEPFYVRPMSINELDHVVQIYLKSFKGMVNPESIRRWFICQLNSYPRNIGFVAVVGDAVRGYIVWCERGGFRQRAVVELEQIAVHPDFRRKGLASYLTIQSFIYLKKLLKDERRSVRLVVIYTSAEHGARSLYEKTLGAKREAVLKDYFRGDEDVLFARFNDTD